MYIGGKADLLTQISGPEAELVEHLLGGREKRAIMYEDASDFGLILLQLSGLFAWKERIFSRIIFLTKIKIHIHIQRKFT